MEEDFIIIGNRILVSKEEWEKVINYFKTEDLVRNLMFGKNHYCESSGIKCDKQCKYCKDEK